MRVNWKEIDVGLIEEACNNSYERYGVYPSVRDLFYTFVDELWPNTKSTYKGLSSWLVQKRLSGEIDWELIRDGGGREIDKGDSRFINPEDFFESHLEYFQKCAKAYSRPKWTSQENKVIVMCEKEADWQIVGSILEDWDVDVMYGRGYSGWRPLFEIAERIQGSERNPIMILLGDFDPSGEDIVRFVTRAIQSDLGISSLVTEKIAVTKEQIEEFRLPHKPEDSEEIRKMRRDPRYKNWEHGLYRVETAALRTKQPEYFDKLIVEAVEKHFDESIYKNIRLFDIDDREKIRQMVKNKLKK